MKKKIKLDDLPVMEDLSAEEVKGIVGGTGTTGGTTSLPGAGTTNLPGAGTTSLPGSGTTYIAPPPPTP
ncbi:MAG: hypothetical protein ACKV0T_30525 [Planctomycetales bacterium]